MMSLTKEEALVLTHIIGHAGNPTTLKLRSLMEATKLSMTKVKAAVQSIEDLGLVRCNKPGTYDYTALITTLDGITVEQRLTKMLYDPEQWAYMVELDIAPIYTEEQKEIILENYDTMWREELRQLIGFTDAMGKIRFNMVMIDLGLEEKN